MSSNDRGDEQKADISNLQENFFKQQKKISALKELVMKSEVAHGKSTSSAQEKVKNIAQRLTNLKSKARSRKSLEKTEHDAAQREGATTKHIAKLTQVTALPATLTIGTNNSTPNPTPLKPSQHSEANTPLSSISAIATTPNPHNLHNISLHATPGSEKIMLLRQQMEENKLRMAQRASSKQHLEQLVTQLKEKFDSTQQSLEDTSELGRSMTDLSALAYSSAPRERHKSATDLSTQPFNLERERMKFLENRCRLLEKQLEKEKQANSMALNESALSQETTKRIKELENKILELEEALGEQQSTTRVEQDLQEEIERLKNELDSRDQSISVGTKEANCSSAVEELSAYEADELVSDNERLKSELDEKLKRITELEEINDLLETTRCELAMKNTSYAEQLQEMKEKLLEAEQNLTSTQKQLEESEERFSSLQKTLEKLSKTTGAIVVETTPSSVSIANLDTDTQIKAEMAKQIQELQDELQLVRDNNAELQQRLADNEKLEVSDSTIAEKIKALEATIESQREDLQTRLANSNRYEEELMEKTIELNVLNANFKVLEEKLQATNKNKPLFTATAEETASQNPELLAEVQQLKQKLDEANKASIKLKLKCKQTEKQMDKLKKTTDLHAEVVRLEKEKEQLQQKIIELEDEKGQWQLQQMGSESEAGSDSGSNQVSLEEQLKLQAETIRLLEQQKYEYTEKLEMAQSELHELKQNVQHRDTEEAERVSAEMCELQLEEQLAAQTKILAQKAADLSEKEALITELKQQLDELNEDKKSIAKKLEHYLSENMELLSKVDKLSKSSSSAESIEIVERLTQQERAEIEEFNKRSGLEEAQEHDVDDSHASESHAITRAVNEVTQTSGVDMNPELSESLLQLREESSELMNKIELFTTERREVLEKMEHLTAENQELQKKIEELQVEKEELETNALLADNEKSQLELKLQDLSKEKQLLATQVAESSAQQAKLSQDLTSLQQSSEVVAVLEGAEGSTLFDKCEKSLSKLNSELEAYRKANDKNAKFNASKKLAKEAKNAYTQLSELLQKVKEASSAVEMVTVVETVVAVTAPNGKALAEYEQLTAQNRELNATIEELRRELQELREDEVQHSHSHVKITEVPAIAANSRAQDVDNKTLIENYEQQIREKEQQLREKENQLKEKERHLEENERVFNIHEKQSKDVEVQLKNFETQCLNLQATVEDLRSQLQEARLADTEKTEEVERLRGEIEELRKVSCDFDRLINDKEMTHEKLIEQATRLRKELEGKCETYESEMEILQTLITEQKQQIIEAYKESEHEMNLKLLELQQRDEELTQLRAELAQLQLTHVVAGEHLTNDLQRECEKLRDALKINKNLVTEQVDELANKQETIDTLSQQITELYKSMEENTNKIIEKEDEIAYLQEIIDRNTKELERLHKDNDDQQKVVDKVLGELHSHRTNLQQVPQLEAELQRLERQNKELEQSNSGLEQRNKELMDKLKKYAANLKKRTTQCQEYELKIADLETGAIEGLKSKEQDEELLELTAKNNQLNATIAQLQTSLQETHSEAAEIRGAIQEKTVQLLETIEKNSRMETELQLAKEMVEKQAQELRQLQNALAASEDQMSDWGNETQSTEYTAKIEKLNAEIAAKTASLERTEQTLGDVQSELLLLQETQNERLRSEQEMRQELQAKTQLVEELRAQATSFNTDRALTELEQRLQTVTEELKTKALKFEKSKAVIKERNNQIQRLQLEIKDLQAKLTAQPEEETSVESHITPLHIAPVQSEEHLTLKHAYDALTAQYQADKANFEKTIARLETLHDGIQAKLQEDLAYIESLEQENAKYKDKICRLEECVGEFEERRASMERRANLLDAQMQTRAEAYERSEDALVYRLNALSEHDDIIAQRLLDSQVEKEELQERLQQLHSELTSLQSDHAQLQNEHQKLRVDTIDTLEAENVAQRTQLNALTEEMKHLRATYDAKLAVKSTEIDELECELSEQLQQIHAEKRVLSEDLERARDECSSQKDEVVRLNESLNALEQAKTELEREASWLRMSQESAQQDLFELQELRMQSIQDKSELDHLRHQIETLASNHEIELQGLRTQIAELDSLRMQVGQNQTDDQVFIETENKRLTDLLAEKEAQIENYQRQNLQLQMAAASANAGAPSQIQQQTQVDAFALAFGLPSSNNVPIQSGNEERCEHLERELADKAENVLRLQRELNTLQAEFHSINDGNTELQRQLVDKQRDIENLRLQLSRTTSTNDVIPAPMFFASEQATPSPFDDLVPARVVDAHVLEGAIATDSNSVFSALEQPTIEDLQRNVSDLEKHAQDLEQKLMLRNQRDGELEERLRDAQEHLHQREEQMHQLQEVVKQQQLQQAQYTNDTEQQLSDLKAKLSTAEQKLSEQEATLRNLQTQRDAELMRLEEHSQNTAVERLAELQANLEQLQRLLEERDSQLQQLKRTLAEETHLKAHEKDLESQIISYPRVEDAALAAAAPTLEMFFGGSNTGEFEQLIKGQNESKQTMGEPAVEEVIVPEKAYVCYPQEEMLNLMDGWGDSWGGGQEEAHFSGSVNEPSTQSHSLISREQQLEFKIQEQQERIQELQLAQERCEQQKQELQLKSGKLMKKLKEYKVKMDELQAANSNSSTFRKSCSIESNSMFGDLDAAIQEELKAQIVQLEGRLEEQRKLQENQQVEKEKLLKRIDVLTAGNDRMSELKERQDMDVQMYQSRIRELQDKLKKLEEWGDSEPVVEATPISQRAEDTDFLLQQQQTLQQKNKSLEAELQDLNDERQELQAMLDEEKANVRYVEETVRNLQNQLATLENADKSKYNELTLEHQNLRERFNQLEEENVRLKHEVENVTKLKTKLEQSLQKASCNEEQEVRLKELLEQKVQLQTKLQTREKEVNDAQLQLLEQRTRCAELVQQIEELQQQPASEELVKQVDMLNSEKQELEHALRTLQSEMARLQATMGNTAVSASHTEPSQNVDELSAQLQEKESEIVHLKQRIEDLMREDQTEKLVLEILTKNQEIHMLKMQVRRLEEDKQDMEHNLTLQITKEMQESKATATPTIDTEGEKVCAMLRLQITELQKRQQELEAEKRNMEAELEVLNNHVLSSLEQEDKLKAAVLELDTKNIEIAELRQTLDTQKSNAPAVDLVTLNAQWEAHVEQKCSEIAEMWRAHLEQREKDFKASENKLQEEIAVLRAASVTLPQQQQQQLQGVSVSADTTATSSASDESTSVSGSSSVAASKSGTPIRRQTHHHHHHHPDSINQEDSETEADAMIERMQAALESQEMEIVTLKEQLAIRSAEYARLAAQYDPFKLQTTLSHSGVNTVTGPSSLESASGRRNISTSDTSVVPKTELDLALYMLHQRDMRCEEMTLELVSLLEERDTLQLKLSNTLRQVEDIKRQTNYVEPIQTQGGEATTSSATNDSPVKTSVAGTTGTGDSSDELSHKLWQLQTVNHSKDKIIKEDRDERIRQMKKIQEDVAKMPSEALSEIVGSDFSRTSQSPSSVLLNWLWGNKPHPTGGAPPS